MNLEIVLVKFRSVCGLVIITEVIVIIHYSG